MFMLTPDFLIRIIRNSGPIGTIELGLMLLSFIAMGIWFLKSKPDGSISSLTWAATLIMATAAASYNAFSSIEQVSAVMSTAHPATRDTVVSGLISQAIYSQIMLALFVPILVLFQLMGSIKAIGNPSKSWFSPAITAAVAMAIGLTLISAAFLQKAGFISALVLALFALFSAIPQAHNPTTDHSAELNFGHALMFTFGISFSIHALTCADQIELFRAVGYAAAESRNELLQVGMNAIEAFDPFYIGAILLSFVPACIAVFKLSGTRLVYGSLTVLTMFAILLGPLLLMDTKGAILNILTME